MMPMEKYVSRTIMTALGVLLKLQYEGESTERSIMEYLRGLSNSYFKLYLMKSFVEAVEVIDY